MLMKPRARLSPAAACVTTLCALALCGLTAAAQTAERRQTGAPPQTQEQTPNAAPLDVAGEISLLRRSVQTLSARLRELGEKAFAPDASKDVLGKISSNMELLSRAELRAETLRKQLIELIEKETAFRTRLVQLDEDMRPDGIDRSISLVGSTRTPEVREARRRVIENERRGVENLLNITNQSRLRLEDDVRQADLLVFKIRQRVLPLIEKEVEKINPN